MDQGVIGSLKVYYRILIVQLYICMVYETFAQYMHPSGNEYANCCLGKSVQNSNSKLFQNSWYLQAVIGACCE